MKRSCHHPICAPRSSALFLALSLWLAVGLFVPQSHGVTFTGNTTITEINNTYIGQASVISGATVTIDGPHSFNSVLRTNNAVLTHSPCTTTNSM